MGFNKKKSKVWFLIEYFKDSNFNGVVETQLQVELVLLLVLYLGRVILL
jgi:hypothetical protein